MVQRSLPLSQSLLHAVTLPRHVDRNITSCQLEKRHTGGIDVRSSQVVAVKFPEYVLDDFKARVLLREADGVGR